MEKRGVIPVVEREDREPVFSDLFHDGSIVQKAMDISGSKMLVYTGGVIVYLPVPNKRLIVSAGLFSTSEQAVEETFRLWQGYQ